jgi:hypothetical protein
MATMELLESITSNSTLSKVSKETYKKTVNGIVRTSVGLDGKSKMSDALVKGEWENLNAALYDIIKNPNKYQPILEKNVSNIKSLNLYYNTIKALIKHSNVKSLEPIKVEWDKFAKVTDSTLRDEAEEHVVTERQLKGMVSWSEVIRTLNGLEKGSMEHLLLCTYVNFTRRQADFSSVRIFKDPMEKIDDSVTCYIHLNPLAPKNPYIHIGKGKTIKHYGAFEWDLPKDLLESLLISLKKEPRDYLFGDKSDDGFRQYSNGTLRKILSNKHVTVTILRHSHAEYIDSIPGVKVGKRREEATKMGHSILKQLEYNLGLNQKVKNSLDPKEKVEICYKRDEKTNKLIEGECIFIDKNMLKLANGKKILKALSKLPP